MHLQKEQDLLTFPAGWRPWHPIRYCCVQGVSPLKVFPLLGASAKSPISFLQMQGQIAKLPVT